MDMENEYFIRNKKERPYKNDGRKEKTMSNGDIPCKRCGRKSGIVGRPVKGYCKSCYTYLNRQKKQLERN